jgi:hypothetical protein
MESARSISYWQMASQIQTAPIGELVGLVARNCLSDCEICQHDGTYFVGFDTVNNTVNFNEFSRTPVDAETVKSI